MMKIHSIIPTLPVPARHPCRAFAGHPCTYLETGAKGPSLGAIHRADFQVGFAAFRAWRSRANVCTDPAGSLHRMPCG